MNNEEIILDNDILELDGIEEARVDWLQYTNRDVAVPRVSHILRQCRDSDGLIQWAANIGRRKYDYYRDKALNIGTLVHEIIDEYLIARYNNHTEYTVDYANIEEDYRSSVYNCFENFKLWESNLNKNGFFVEEVVGLEIPVTCPWYGGTIDGIVKINGAYYIIDFKTSKKISPEYLLQTSAYMWIINNRYVDGLPIINGIGIIRVDKQKYGVINDLFISNFTAEQSAMITNYQKCFMSYVDSFYRTINTDYITENYNYNRDNVFKE